MFCINALHHFPDQQRFFSECRRVLRPGGGLLTIGLDPHEAGDEWWVYDFFPTTLSADRRRFSSTSTIRGWLSAAGFREPATEVADQIVGEIPFEAAEQKGFTDGDQR